MSRHLFYHKWFAEWPKYISGKLLIQIYNILSFWKCSTFHVNFSIDSFFWHLCIFRFYSFSLFLSIEHLFHERFFGNRTRSKFRCIPFQSWSKTVCAIKKVTKCCDYWDTVGMMGYLTFFGVIKLINQYNFL